MKPQTTTPRICLLTNSFYPRIGGGENHALRLCQAWRQRGINVFVLTRRTTHDLKKHEDLNGLQIHRLPPCGWPRLGKYLVTLPALLALLVRHQDYDLIYVCGLRVAGIPAMLAARLLNKICVLRSESRGEFSGDFIWQSPDPRIRQTRWKPLVRAALRARNRLLIKASAFVSISREIDDEYRRCGVPAARIRLIHNGIDTVRFAPVPPERRLALRRELGLPNLFCFVYAGKLNKGKGLEMLLRAWKGLVTDQFPAHLVLVGGGAGQFLSCEEFLRDFVKSQGLESHVTFTGYKPDVEHYLQAADVFVFPSESEAFSVALLEAMACELACLASDIPGNREAIEDGINGRLLPVDDAEAWRNGMADCLRHPERLPALGKAARTKVLGNFSIERVAEEHLALFRELMAQSTRKP